MIILTRMVFSLVLFGGALGAAGTLAAGVDNEILEESEDDRSVEEAAAQVRVARESSSPTPSARLATLSKVRVPQVLVATGAAPARPSWQRPRRTSPDDDETDARA